MTVILNHNLCFDNKSPDINGDHFCAKSRVALTAFFIRTQFSNVAHHEHDVEKVLQDYLDNNGIALQNPAPRIGIKLDSPYYRTRLLNYLVQGFQNPVETIPEMIRLLNGETIRIPGNRIMVTTTAMNFSSLEKLVTHYLHFVTMPSTILDSKADFSVAFDTVKIENYQEIFDTKYYFFDKFEVNNNRYSFDIVFDLNVKLTEPIRPSKTLKKYANSLKGSDSTHFLQIIRDIIEHPGKIAYSIDNNKLYLKPKSFEEAANYFCKRYARSHRFRLFSLFGLGNLKCPKVTKTGLCNIWKKVPSQSSTLIFHLDLGHFLNRTLFKENFKNLQEQVDTSYKLIQKYRQSNNIQPLVDFFGDEGNYSFLYASLYINAKALHENRDLYLDRIETILLDLKNGLQQVAEMIHMEKIDCHPQLVATQMLQKQIAMDPTSYIEDENEIISEYANILITGF